MKAFVVTILAPDSWTKANILSSVNVGMRKYSQDEQLELRALDYHAMCHGEFELREPER